MKTDLIELKTDTIEIKTVPVIKPPAQAKPLVRDLRNMLKDLLQKEIEEIPGLLRELDPAQRLNIICKLIPYVLPKTESVSPKFDEPDEFKMNAFYQ